VAGGRGSRLGGVPKQLRSLGGRPVVCWAARSLLTALAGTIVVVLPEELLEEGEALLGTHLGEDGARVEVTAGGPRRQDSVRHGLAALADASTVLVHDAARPFASSGLVERVGRHAAAGRAVVPGLAPADTLKRVEEDRVIETLDRSRLIAAQTPQGFPLSLLRDAHEAWPDAGEATDDAAVCERFGVPVSWVPGEPLNRKLTDAEDWWWAERLLAEGRVRWDDRG
jgi:2-C-methyl-D-erythritol 4-phosphate cytidylyltransferase